MTDQPRPEEVYLDHETCDLCVIVDGNLTGIVDYVFLLVQHSEDLLPTVFEFGTFPPDRFEYLSPL